MSVFKITVQRQCFVFIAFLLWLIAFLERFDFVFYVEIFALIMTGAPWCTEYFGRTIVKIKSR